MTITIDTSIIGKPTIVGNNSEGYALNKILIPNIPTQGPDAVASLTITIPGAYSNTVPLISFNGGGGSGAAAFAVMYGLVGTDVAAGSGYANGNTITISGGTFSTASVLTVNSTTLVSANISLVGGGYAPGDTSTMSGGTASVNAILTIVTTQLEALEINAAGTGYLVNDFITLTGGTFSSPAIFQVTAIDGGGGVTDGVITTPGSYTVNGTTFTQSSTTGIGLGVTFNTPSYGGRTFSILNGGTYTVNGATLVQSSSSGSGSGLTLNTTLYGVKTVQITTGGSYTALPSNPVSQNVSSGSGTGATFNMIFGVLSATVTSGGDNYVTAPNVVFNSGSAAATASLAEINDPFTVSLSFTSPLPVSNYTVQSMANQAAVLSYANKTINGCDVTVTPLFGTSLAAGTIDSILYFTN